MLSTITARLASTNDEYIASITHGMGVIDKNTGELRSTFDILQDLSKEWENLSSVEQNELAETVAGKTQRALFTALMTNFGSAVGATEAALNSEGSAAEENAKRMDSLQGKVQQLESAWQNFARNTVNSDFVKNILSALTSLIKLVDKVGGLSTVLAAATAALMLFKGGLIIDKAFNVFTSGLNMIKNGLTTVTTALPNAITAFKSFSAGVVSAGTAIEAAVPLLSLIALAITGVVQGLNAYKNAQKEATQAAIESSQKAKEEADNKKTKIETTEKEIKKLEEERDALLKNSEGTGENGTASKNLAQDKQEEIEKRQQNIDKMKEETAESLKQREAAARSMTTNKADDSLGWLMNQKEILDDMSVSYHDYRKEVDSVNASLKETDGNTGAYQRTLESLRAKYEEMAQTKEKNNESSVVETNIIKELNTEIEQNKEKYEEDKKVADEFYSIIKDGGSISQENLEWMQDFLDLSDEQIEQLKEGIDVLNEQTEATGNYIDAVGGLTDAQKEMQDSLTYTDEELKNINDDIDNTQSAYATLASAVDEYNSSGGITMDTLQQLLSLDSEYLSSLELVNGKLQISQAAQDAHSKAMETDTLALIENAAMEDLMAMATEGAGNTASAAGSKIYSAGENAKKAGDYAREGAQGFIELAGAMSQAGMIDPNSGVDTKAWANKWAGITNNIKSLTSSKGGGLTSSRFTGKSGGSGRKSSGGSGRKSSGGSGRKSGSGKKSGSGGASKSTKEEYKAEIDTLYNYKNALENAKESVDKLKDAIKDTDNFNEQEKYIRQVIDALNDEINKTNDLKNAQTGQINDYINQLRAQGFSIDYNAQKNELYINNMQHLADFSGDAAKKLEKLIKKTQDLNDDNRDLDGTVRDLRSDVKDYYEQLEDIPEKKLKKFNELMKEFQQGRLDQIQNQIDDIQHEMENDVRLQQLENQIEALENQNDELDKQKELEEKLLAVEEAKEKLANANRQKTLQVYRERSRVKCEPL